MVQSTVSLDLTPSDVMPQQRIGERLGDVRQQAFDVLTMRSPNGYDGVVLRRYSQETLVGENTTNISATGALLLDEADEGQPSYQSLGKCRVMFMQEYGSMLPVSLDSDFEAGLQQRMANIVLTDGVLRGDNEAISEGDMVYLQAGVGYLPYRVDSVMSTDGKAGLAKVYMLEPTGNILYDDELAELDENGIP